MTDFVGEMEHFITQIRVAVLKINVLSENNFKGCKVLKNSFIEKLIITGPCNFEAVPIMENLKEIEVHMTPRCTHSKAKVEEGHSQGHKPGLCILNLAAVFEHCPKLEQFRCATLNCDTKAKPKSSVFHLDGLRKKPNGSKNELTFTTWNIRLKKVFHAKYTEEGGTMDLKSWSKSRWAKKRLTIPENFGRERRDYYW